MNAINYFKIFERLIDYGRNKLATDVDHYAIEWLRQSGFIKSVNNATDAGKQQLNMFYFSRCLQIVAPD